MSVEKRPIREGMPVLLYLANRTSTIESCSVGNSYAQSNWFAVSTTPRHEKRVAQHFGLREVECFLPLYRTQRRWNDGSKVALDLPLFPGYIFVRIGRKERTRVLQVPGVLALVAGTGREPAALCESEIEALRSGICQVRAEPHPLLRTGQKARIRSGALAGMAGVIVRMKNSMRVVLTLELIMQSIAVEVDCSDLEMLAA
jgi:transcription antitermination factor NusG